MYAELRCKTAFSFLRGASAPEALAERAAELGLPAVALVDADGVYGAPRLHKAARKLGLRAIVGAEAWIAGHPVALLCESSRGYRNLCRLLTDGKLRRGHVHKGHPERVPDALGWTDLEAHAEGLHVLSGGGEGAFGAALDRGDGDAAAAALDRLVGIFGKANVSVELQLHLDEVEDRRNAAAVALARRHRLPVVATNDVRFARPADALRFDVLTCLAEGTTIDRAGTRLCANAERRLKSPAEMRALFRDLPEAVENAGALGDRLAFSLEDLGYRFPDYPLPPGESATSFLRRVVLERAPSRFRPFSPRVRAQLDRELTLIGKLGLEGYFLIVWDLVELCRRERILAQGRGSAANSAVCFALGITACDPVKMDLLFERFLSEERGEWPDIDIDLPSGDARERVIQHVYTKYGERGAAMTANVITYRGRSAVRDAGKVLGLDPEALGRLSGLLNRYEFGAQASEEVAPMLRAAGFDPDAPRVRAFARLAIELQDLPRHLGQHSGGMVIAAGRLDEVVPLEPASMPGRVVVQWDKEDCADLGLIKVDLLGLGMMAVLATCLDEVPRCDHVPLDLAAIPHDDPGVFRMLQKADTVGLFQVESRAQMATLPRLHPETFYDLVVEVALIRPGPIVGQMVHPYLRRRRKREEVRYAHPCLEPILARTLGVPLFQEQVMRMAMEAAGFSGGQAEELRRAMGFKRSEARMKALETQLYEGMAARGIVGEVAAEIVQHITSFALYGFPESHAISFALIAYASAYLKLHHPAVFVAALLDAWPMGFYHPATIVKDAQRHGVRVLPVDVVRSEESCRALPSEAPGRASHTLRLGLKYVRGLRQEAAREIVSARAHAFESVGDLVRRCPGLRKDELDALAESGALASLGATRRDALWQVSALADARGTLFDGAAGQGASPLSDMSLDERIEADYRNVGVTVGPHPLARLRPRLAAEGVVTARALEDVPDGARVAVAGVVIVRQRPGTAKGFFFLTLEDETGLSSAIVTPQRFEAHKRLLGGAPAMIVEGVLQRTDGTLNVRGDRFRPLLLGDRAPPSRDFH